MDLTLYIRLEHPPKGTNHAKTIAGKAAAKNWNKLSEVARDLQVKSLQSFVSSSATDPTTLNAPSDARLPGSVVKEQWFSPGEALQTIRKLMSRISADKRAFQDYRLLMKDLQSFENILGSAEARGSRFHFAKEF